MAGDVRGLNSWLTKDDVIAFLLMHHVEGKLIQDALDGYDFDQPIYFRDFAPPEMLYQYIRKPSFSAGNGQWTGNWFALKGATQDDLAITSGASGRLLHRFEVLAAFRTIEGTAKQQPKNLARQIGVNGIGGRGRGTQIYVPRSLLGHLKSLGPDE